jgi:hypothetical protein
VFSPFTDMFSKQPAVGLGSFRGRWEKYRKTRRGDYAFRARTRYAGVFAKLQEMGLADGDGVLDMGAGDCHFGRYLFEQGWRGSYCPRDATIGKGYDLESWTPKAQWTWVVAIEVAEHLIDPLTFLRKLTRGAKKGAVITTPNPRVVDVLRCDPTHVSIITEEQLTALGWNVSQESYFSEQLNPGQLDTLLASRRRG